MIPFCQYCSLLEMAYPSSFSFEEFERISSYSGKIRYATQHLRRISSGSSRVIFKIDDEKVLKVAKNIKGLGQNNTEADWYLQEYDVIAKVFERGDSIKDEGPFWIEMELAKRVPPKRFQELTGLSIQEVQNFLIWFKGVNHPVQGRAPYIEDELKNKVSENEWFGSLQSMIMDYDMEYPGDFGRLNSYGEVLRDGKPTIVLVDFGLSRQVWLNYYAKN